MRPILWLCVLFLSVLSSEAVAGESRHLGVVLMTGLSVTNVTTAAPFQIPAGAKLTINCSAAVQVLTDSTTVSVGTTGTKGLPVGATSNFPTSVGQARSTVNGNPSAVIAFIGTAATTCDIWLRDGAE
jgi:hypothetical protein